MEMIVHIDIFQRTYITEPCKQSIFFVFFMFIYKFLYQCIIFLYYMLIKMTGFFI